MVGRRRDRICVSCLNPKPEQAAYKLHATMWSGLRVGVGTCRPLDWACNGSEESPVILPVFKTGDRHLRCRWCVRLAHASAKFWFPRPARDFCCGLPSLRSSRPQVASTSKPAIGIFDVDGAFDSHTLPPSFGSLDQLGISAADSRRCAPHARKSPQLQNRRSASLMSMVRSTRTRFRQVPRLR